MTSTQRSELENEKSTPAASPSPHFSVSPFSMDAAGLALLAALFVWTYWLVLPGLVAQWWNEDDYSHGFLIPLISVGIVWWKRKELAAVAIRPGYAGLAVMALAVVLYVAGSVGSDLFLQRISIVVMLCGAVWFLAGWAMFKVLAFPLGYLLLMVPLPGIIFNSIAFPLQMLAAQIATNVMQMLSIPVLREGNVMHLAQVSLDVEEACSGIRSLISLTALGVLFAYIAESKWIPRLVLVLSVAPIAVAANVFRVTVTGLIAHYVSADAALGFFHGAGAISIFILAMLLLFSVAWLLKLVGVRR